MADARLRLARADAARKRDVVPDVETAEDDVPTGVVEPASASEPSRDHGEDDADATEDDDEPDDDDASPAGAGRGLLVAAAVVVVAVVAVLVVVLRPGHHDAAADPGLASGDAFRVEGTTVSEAALAERAQVLHVLYGLQIPTSGADLATFRRRTALALATSIVIDRTAQDDGVAISPQVASAGLQRYIASRYPAGSSSSFTDLLSQNHITKQDVLDEVTRQLDGERLFDKVTTGIPAVTPAQVEAAYRAHPASWNQPEQRQLRDIVVTSRAKAEQVLGDLQHGAPFATEAKRYSQDSSTSSTGGELGTLTAADLTPAFARVAFAARPGALFGPVETNLGWYVGQVQKVVPARTTLAQLRTSISQSLAASRSLTAWNAYVKKLMASADVTYASTYQPLPSDQPTADIPGITGPATGPSTSPSTGPSSTPSAG